MALFVVCYDLYHSKNYDDIKNALKKLDSVHTQESVWYVDRSGDAKDLYDYLKSYINDKDRLMVVEFHRKPSWQNSIVGTKDWISDKFS